MADYKVVDGEKLDSGLTAIADAIREKTGGEEALSMDAMVSEIGSLSGAAKPCTVTVSTTKSDFASSGTSMMYVLYESNGTFTKEVLITDTPLEFTVNVGDCFCVHVHTFRTTSVNLTANLTGAICESAYKMHSSLGTDVTNFTYYSNCSEAFLIKTTEETATVVLS